VSVTVQDYELVTGLFAAYDEFEPGVPVLIYALGFGFSDRLAYKVVRNQDKQPGQPDYYLLKQRLPSSNP